MKLIVSGKDIVIKLFQSTVIVFLLLILLLYTVEYFTSGKKMSDEDIVHFFTLHHLELKKVIPLCRDHPALRWLGKKEGQVFFYSTHSVTPADYDAARLIRSILDPLGLKSVACTRRFDLPGDPFFGVSFTLYAGWGEVKAIDFFQPESGTEETEGYKAGIKTGELKPLPEPGWYIYTSQ